jgi:hypothetical protein
MSLSKACRPHTHKMPKIAAGYPFADKKMQINAGVADKN